MGTYSVVYKGLRGEDRLDAKERIAEGIASRLPMSLEEILTKLNQPPFVLVSGESQLAARRLAIFLTALGARADVRQDHELAQRPFEAAQAKPYHPSEKWIFAGGIRTITYNLATGLLIVTVILFAGIVQILAGGLVRFYDQPFWQLGVSGWITLGLGILLLIGLFVLRLPWIMKVLSAADQSTPLKTLESYLKAINTRHWNKAVTCLAFRPGSTDLGAKDKHTVFTYLKSLAHEVSLPNTLDPATVSVLHHSEDKAELRLSVATVARKTLSDGTRVQRTLVEICRFVLLDDRWYLLDGKLLGQLLPERLPLPGCRECGIEVRLGDEICPGCGSPLPSFRLEKEQWLTPQRKPDLAALLSALFPGLGQAYNGQPLKGLLIAATCWMILPWAAGVVDAKLVAERINSKSSYHDLHSRPFILLSLHLIIVVTSIMFIVYNAERIPLLQEIIFASQPPQEQPDTSAVVGRFRGPDGNYSILFPHRWTVTEVPPPDDGNDWRGIAVQAISPDGKSSILISTRGLPTWWAECVQAIEARRKMENEGAEIADFRCGTVKGRRQYLIVSFTPDRQWRRSLLVIATEQELVALAFICPVDQQERMVKVFDSVAESIRFYETGPEATSP